MIFIATPLYENKVWVPYLHGFVRTLHELAKQGWPVEYSFQKGTHIAMNREHLVRDFLKTECKFLVFIDSDIAFEPKDIFELIASNVDVVSGVYRFRNPTKAGQSILPIKLINGEYLDLGKGDVLQECEFVPGGMLVVRRSAIEQMYEKVPYIFDQGFDKSNPPISIEEDFVGEDVTFCKVWRDLGGKIYVNTKVLVGHLGEFEYRI